MHPWLQTYNPLGRWWLSSLAAAAPILAYFICLAGLRMKGHVATGGVTGKMISPQSIAVGSAAVGLVGNESDVLRFTLKHSLGLVLIVCAITAIQAYLLPGMAP